MPRLLWTGLCVLLVVGVNSLKDDDDSCLSYAGGSVYPTHFVRGVHDLHSTKAFSEL